MINKVILLGRVGIDLVIKETSSGVSLASFSLATNNIWKDKNGDKKEKTEWHKIVIFNDKIVKRVIEKYVSKGSQLYIEGSLTTRKYTDNEGIERYTTEIIINSFNDVFKIISSKKSEEKEISEDNIPY